MKNKLLTLAGRLTGLAVLGPFYAKPLLAQVRAALVQIANTPVSAVPTVQAPPQAQIYRSNCEAPFSGTSQASCNLTAVPSGQTLFVETVSMATGVSPVSSPYFGAFRGSDYSGPGGSYRVYLPLIPQASTSGQSTFLGTVSARTPILGPDTPVCEMVLTNGSSLAGSALRGIWLSRARPVTNGETGAMKR